MDYGMMTTTEVGEEIARLASNPERRPVDDFELEQALAELQLRDQGPRVETPVAIPEKVAGLYHRGKVRA